VHEHHEGAAEARAQTGGDKGLAHGEGDAVDQRLAHAQHAGGQSADDGLLHPQVLHLAGLQVDRQGRAHLARAGHGQAGEQGHAAKGLQLHGVDGDQAVVQAQQHHGQEHRAHDVAGDDADNGVGGVDEEAEQEHQPVGEEAGDGHEDKHVQGADNNHAQQGGEDQIQHVGDDLAQPLLHLGEQPNADNHADDAALAGGQDGVEGHVGVIEPQQGGDGDDLGADGDAADHAAQGGGGAEDLGRVHAGIDGEIAQEGGAEEAEEGLDDEDDARAGGDGLGEQLAHEAGQTVEQARGDDGGDHGDEDVGDGAQALLQGAVLLPGLHGGLVGLPVVIRAQAALHARVRHKQIAHLLGLAGAQDDLERGVLHHAQHALGGLQRGNLRLAVVPQLDAQAGHAVGGADNVALAAHQFQDLQG